MFRKRITVQKNKKGGIEMVTNLACTVIVVIGGFSLLKVMAGKSSLVATIFLNIIFGGFLFVMLNICNFNIPFNFLTGSFITFLGFPGVILLIILKIMFRF